MTILIILVSVLIVAVIWPDLVRALAIVAFYVVVWGGSAALLFAVGWWVFRGLTS